MAIDYYKIFRRVSKELYAPALGGIMLSIGIQLSFDDFTLAFKRFVCLSSFLSLLLIHPISQRSREVV